jgi:hypothetical protein
MSKIYRFAKVFIPSVRPIDEKLELGITHPPDHHY